MSGMERDIKTLICYPASRIHSANSISDTQRRVVERDVLRLLWRVSWIVLILYEVSKLK